MCLGWLAPEMLSGLQAGTLGCGCYARAGDPLPPPRDDADGTTPAKGRCSPLCHCSRHPVLDTLGHSPRPQGQRVQLRAGAATSTPGEHGSSASSSHNCCNHKSHFFLPTRSSCPILLIKKNNKDMENSVISLSSFLDLAFANLKQTPEWGQG